MEEVRSSNLLCSTEEKGQTHRVWPFCCFFCVCRVVPDLQSSHLSLLVPLPLSAKSSFGLSAGPAERTLEGEHPGRRREPGMRDQEPARPRPELATMLATEHWSLLGTRSMTWTEIMSRISILLTVMSAFLVVLALAARGAGFDRSLLGLAIAFAAASLVAGSLTALRVALASQEDAQLVRGMNRLRAAYVELAPEIAPYLTASTKDDRAGLMATYTLGSRRHMLVHIIGSTTFFVIVINTLVAGTLGALVGAWARGTGWVTVLSGTFGGLVWFGLQLEVARRLFGAPVEDVRVPTEP